MREHVTDGSPCWCNPRMCIICPECENPAIPDEGCGRCKGEGIIDVDGPVAPDVAVISVHDEPDGFLWVA